MKTINYKGYDIKVKRDSKGGFYAYNIDPNGSHICDTPSEAIDCVKAQIDEIEKEIRKEV